MEARRFREYPQPRYTNRAKTVVWAIDGLGMGTTRLYERWEELDKLFEQAVALPAEEVDAFCRSACGDDAELYELLLDLVASAEASDETVKRSISKLAQDVADDTPLTGEDIGPYRLEELLGRGGMGDVYLASRADGAFDKKVAIKVVRSGGSSDRLAQQFRRERQLLADLNHPFIPALIDAGQLDDGRMYFIGEYIDGVPISEYCDDPAVSLTDKLTLLAKVGEALQHAHNNLVLHLDIKPDNVLVEADGTPRLLDFGIARLFDEELEGYRAFTPGYASPEQIRGERVTPASDVFSLGALAFRVLTGSRPFESPRFAPSATVLAERDRPETRVAQIAMLDRLDEDLKAIVSEAMREDPAERYPSVESFLRDLKHYRIDLPVTARRGSYGYRLGKYLKRQRVAIGVVVLIVSGLAGFLLREAELRQQAQEASAEAAREAEASRQIADFMVDLFEVSDPGEARGNSVTARELLDGGAGRIMEKLQEQPLIQSRLMRVMGDVYSQLGLHGDAATLLENALTIRDEAVPDGDAETGLLLTRLGILYMRQTRLDDAEQALYRSLELNEGRFGAFHPSVGDSLTFIGVLQTLRGDYAAAETSLLRALGILEEHHGPNELELAEPLANLATVYYRSGRLDEGIDLQERTLAIRRTLQGTDHPAVAIALDNLGNMHQAAGENRRAIELLEEALAIREKVLSPEHPLVASNLDNLSNAYFALGDFARTETLKLEALRIREKVLGPSHRHVATSLGNLGNLYMERGELDKAEGYLRRSKELRAELYEPDHPRVAIAAVNLGSLYLKRDDIDRAAQETLEAIDILKGKLPEDHLYRLYSDWQLANIRDRQGRIDEARRLFERVHPLWQARPAEDRDRSQMLQDYAAFVAEHGETAGETD